MNDTVERAIRDYALHNEALILQVSVSSSDAEHRAIAAQMLGYARQSDQQVEALVHASLDADDGVRMSSGKFHASLEKIRTVFEFFRMTGA